MPRVALALLVLLAACAAPADPGLRPHGPRAAAASNDVDWAETSFTGAGGVQLYAQRWRPLTGTAKAVVVIHHGLADHSDRYDDLALQLVRDGYTVWAMDMRGHGRSAGHRVTADRVDDFLDDLDAFFTLVRAQEPGRPLFLYGHSLGGLITCLYTIERQPDLAGLILAAPALAFDAPPAQVAVIRTLAALNPNAPALPTPHKQFSRRADVVAEMDADPLIYQPKGPVRTARATIDGVARVWAAPERLRVPLLVLHGTADQLTAPAGSRDLVARAGSADKTLRIYDGLYHDLLREPDGAGDRVRGEIVAWLDAHTGGAAFAPEPQTIPAHLAGDPKGRSMSIELDARAELPRDATGKAGGSGGLRLRAGFGHALGYMGGLDLRGGDDDGHAAYQADLHALGVALRTHGGALLAITGGVGIGGARGAGATHLPVELDLQLPAGPLRLLARAGLGWRLGGATYAGNAHGLADEASALIGVRLGRDRHYWSTVVGGAGPYLAATYRDLGGVELFGVAVGVDLWGGD